MTSENKQLWFDPKNPPRTPVYVGQKIPIYIVPDDTKFDELLVQPSWVKTNYVFKVVNMHYVENVGNVVDVQWPNGHVDTNVPISSCYGHYARIPKFLVSHFTEKYTDNRYKEYLQWTKTGFSQPVM